MKVFKNNQELIDLIKDGQIIINDDILCDFDINVEASISAFDISARNISAFDISALDISALDISALDISAFDISYYAFCIAYSSIKCKSIKGRRDNSFHKCLDKEIEITSMAEPKQPELKGISDAFQNFTDELKSMGL